MGIDPLVTATGQVTASSLMLLPLALAVDRPWTLDAPDGTTWAAVVGIAIPSTAIAYILYFQILARAGATNLLLVTFLIPVSAIVMGSAVLGERLLAGHFAGMAMIGLGLAAIDGRVLKIIDHRASSRQRSPSPKLAGRRRSAARGARSGRVR